MLKKILSISGRPGLFRLVNQGRNMLIVESLETGKRCPAYAHDKIVSLGDIAIYTNDEEVALADVFETIKQKYEGKQVDLKQFAGDAQLRESFKEILPTFDEDRVYTNDIRKIYQWYNKLIAAGFETFKEEQSKDEAASEAAE